MSVLLNEITTGEPEPAVENLNGMADERRPLIDRTPHVRVDIEAIKLNVRAPELLRLVDHNPEARVEIVVGAVNLNFRAAGPPPVTDQESDADDVNKNKIMARQLRIIDEDPEKKLVLQNWETMRSEFNKRIDAKSTEVIAIKADLYQFIGICTAFQGLIITALALSNALSCKISWVPGLLSLFASVVAHVGVYSKLEYYHLLKNTLYHWRIAQAELASQIDDFKFNRHIPDEKNGDIPDEKNGDICDESKHSNGEENLRKRRQKFETALTLTILAIFSFFVFASCFVILCAK